MDTQGKEKGSREKPLSISEKQERLLNSTYEEMFTVDYSQSDSFALELSFTLLDLKILERIINDKTYDFLNVCEEQRL